MPPLHAQLAAVAARAGLGYLALASAARVPLAAAAALQSSPPAPGAPQTRFAILIPAHDEAGGIAETIAAVQALDYPDAQYEIVVVADNCSDDTAARALAAGARVLERTDPDRPGKGAALGWAIPQLLQGDVDAVLLLDADCVPSSNMLAALNARFGAGAQVIQTDYRVANPEASSGAALRYAGFALQNAILTGGRARLGMSSGLNGTGIALTRDVLERHPWAAFGLAEDREYHITLVSSGERVVFAGEACVYSDMPTVASVSSGQEMRWESGRMELLQRTGPRLAAAAVRYRDPRVLSPGLDLIVPPQALWAASSLATLAVSLVSRRRSLIVLSASSLAAQAVFVLGGLAVAGAPRAVWVSFAAAPGFVARRMSTVLTRALGRGPKEWVRTDRSADDG